MLAQSFMTAQELRISDKQFDALRKTLTLFETGKVRWINSDHRGLTGEQELSQNRSFTGLFNMSQWSASYHKCGTVACIGGTAEMIGGIEFSDAKGKLRELFYPDMVDDWNQIGVSVAAQAIRNYLTHGSPMWETIVGKEFLVAK